MDFNIHVTESGEEYNETIEVDTQKQTEVFKVPAHPGVDRSDVMHDFKQVIISSTTLLDVTCCVRLQRDPVAYCCVWLGALLHQV